MACILQSCPSYESIIADMWVWLCVNVWWKQKAREKEKYEETMFKMSQLHEKRMAKYINSQEHRMKWKYENTINNPIGKCQCRVKATNLQYIVCRIKMNVFFCGFLWDRKSKENEGKKERIKD